MSFFSAISNVFKSVGKLFSKAFDLARLAGVDDEIIAFALKWIRVADSKYVDNAQRREWVVKILMDRKVPESIARLVTELAYGIYKKEKSKLGV